MKVSVIIRARNEYPVILSTIHALQEDLEWSGIEHEFIVVDNCSNDDTADILEDRYRRWVKEKKLKVLRYTEKSSTWCAINAGYTVSDGDVVVVCDAHITVSTGTLELLTKQANERGGIWHASTQIWGDTRQRNYGYDLTLEQNFWGNPCRFIPPGASIDEPWQIPMAGACLFAVSRREIEEFGFYHPSFKTYGGGEPYLAFKWWLMGSKVWVEPRALCRHAFGLKARWVKAKKEKKTRGKVYLRNGTVKKNVDRNDEYLNYHGGYTIPLEDKCYNFLLAAYLIGCGKWLERVTESFQSKFRDKKTVYQLAEQVCRDGGEDRERIGQNSVCSFDQLLEDPPWLVCDQHRNLLESTT